MAKKKREPSWHIDPNVAKREAKKSITPKIADTKGERKIIKVYEEAHRRAKFMAFEQGVTLINFMELLINKEWEKRKPQ